MIALTVSLMLGLCPGGSDGCYDYDTRVITLNPSRVTPYVLTHEIGHAYYFQQANRGQLIVGDPAVREEEAFADLYAACTLSRGPGWMRRTGYRVRVSTARYRRICGLIRRSS